MEHYFTNNEQLKSELRDITYTLDDTNFTFISDNGVFSKNKIDYGSKFLVETMLKQINKTHISILDMGCGYGFIGIVLAKKLDSLVTLADVNKRALHLAKENSRASKVEAQIVESSIYDKISDTFDIIVTNPPIRAGKKVVEGMLLGASSYLKDDGELWCVIRKDQGAKSMVKVLEDNYKTSIVAKSKGFYAIKAEKK